MPSGFEPVVGLPLVFQKPAPSPIAWSFPVVHDRMDPPLEVRFHEPVRTEGAGEPLQIRYSESSPVGPVGTFAVEGDRVSFAFDPDFALGYCYSVSVTEAKALDDCLAARDTDLAKRFFKATKKLTDSPWTIATGEDLKYPQIEGKRPPGLGLINRYMDRVHKAAAKDEVVLRQFFLVANLLASPMSVMSPRIAWRVLLGGRGEAQELPLKPGMTAPAEKEKVGV